MKEPCSSWRWRRRRELRKRRWSRRVSDVDRKLHFDGSAPPHVPCVRLSAAGVESVGHFGSEAWQNISAGPERRELDFHTGTDSPSLPRQGWPSLLVNAGEASLQPFNTLAKQEQTVMSWCLSLIRPFYFSCRSESSNKSL